MNGSKCNYHLQKSDGKRKRDIGGNKCEELLFYLNFMAKTS